MATIRGLCLYRPVDSRSVHTAVRAPQELLSSSKLTAFHMLSHWATCKLSNHIRLSVSWLAASGPQAAYGPRPLIRTTWYLKLNSINTLNALCLRNFCGTEPNDLCIHGLQLKNALKCVNSIQQFNKLHFYIYIPTNCTQLIFFINNTLKYLYCLKL